MGPPPNVMSGFADVAARMADLMSGVIGAVDRLLSAPAVPSPVLPKEVAMRAARHALLPFDVRLPPLAAVPMPLVAVSAQLPLVVVLLALLSPVPARLLVTLLRPYTLSLAA